MINKTFIIIICICLIQFFSNNFYAVEPDEILENKEQELRARNISKNIRCMVCQNQSIDESNATLARDLRILIRNKIKNGKNDEETWSGITTNQGSVSHLDFLTQEEKDVFKTAFELDQRWIVDLGADRTPHISQAQSINIFIPADTHKKNLHQIHFQAWKKGLKSLY